MLFATSNLEKLKVIYMTQEDSRTYVPERVGAVIDGIRHKYDVRVYYKKEYNDIKFDQCVVFEHEDGKFKVIDYSDWDRPTKMECADIIEHPLCQFVIKCQYNPVYHIPKLRPFFYFEKTHPRKFSEMIEELRLVPKTSNKLHWRGNFLYGRDRVINEIRDLLNETCGERLSENEYYREVASYRLCLSLPGRGKACHREFECFGIGTAVVAPRFQNICHIPLIPDYHYICVDAKTPTDLPNQIRRKINSLEPQQVEAVRQNAMTYYDNYIRFDNSIKWLIHLLEL